LFDIEDAGARSLTRNHVQLPPDDPKQPNIGQAFTQLGWKPRVTLREGLIKTIAYFEEFLARQQ